MAFPYKGQDRPFSLEGAGQPREKLRKFTGAYSHTGRNQCDERRIELTVSPIVPRHLKRIDQPVCQEVAGITQHFAGSGARNCRLQGVPGSQPEYKPKRSSLLSALKVFFEPEIWSLRPIVRLTGASYCRRAQALCMSGNPCSWTSQRTRFLHDRGTKSGRQSTWNGFTKHALFSFPPVSSVSSGPLETS